MAPAAKSPSPAPEPGPSGSPGDAASPKVTARRTIHSGRKFDYEAISVELPNGHTLVREVVRHPGAAIIVPVLPDGRLVLTRVYRAACDQWLLEFPAGTLDKNEEPAACAARELEEETGYRPATVTPLDWTYTSPGLSDERMHMFLATGLTHVGQKLEEDENIVVEIHDVATVTAMIDSGIIRDAKTVVAFARARARGHIEAATARRGG
jgi:ADP-ribose pyrophosphatase